MNLFTVAKIPMYCEGITHRLEKRKSGDEVKVVDLALKIQPFSSQLAAALNQDEYAIVKRTLFKMSNGEPVVDLRSVEFRPPADRQRLTCFASPDSGTASICLDQVKVTKLRARSSKDATGWTVYVHVSFGPLDKSELMYVNDFYTSQRFITFEEAEPSLDFADDDDPDDEQEGLAPGVPAPMWSEGEPADDKGTSAEGAEARGKETEWQEGAHAAAQEPLSGLPRHRGCRSNGVTVGVHLAVSQLSADGRDVMGARGAAAEV